MASLKTLVHTAAIAILLICCYAFLLGNKVFEGKFETDAVSWSFPAKGIFCALSLHLSVRLLEAVDHLAQRR